ncbi:MULTISPECIES: MFS transporter [unclassified Paenibacillus]|uniref:MFS transporter n=1 Tax=unclassified Paenibacillus TaxID=185978 RepID=UPI000956788B|nr:MULTISPECIES: MFS transporter [unclassified Paenibacillus]ASS68994.1 MFS transporter [Paenibacillus sp. RUD330]SIR11486.1 Predicted arabinose efflux permease, MFS family [Paenibacillus sp. RU4X]SIR25540.1 Predicted arabinose efflux permease, MFS family [Paenibacillus sp. RU4T]
MNRKRLMETWKYPSILLLGIGVANIGGWIYFIALNLIVLDATKSAMAVSILYLLRPLAAMAASFWSGSLIDRMNKRSLMIALDAFRAILIFLLPLFDSIAYMYGLVFLIQMAGSLFGPASGTYIAKLIPPEQRPRFNSLNGLIGSGAFLIGPAIAGLLFLVGSPTMAIYINAAALLFSAGVTMLMPDLEKGMFADLPARVDRSMIRQDWSAVIAFYRSRSAVLIVCLLFSAVMVVMATAVDSLEAAFAQKVLGLSDSGYGLLVSIAGAGIIAGASVNAAIVRRLAASAQIGFGAIGVSFGYLVYAFSADFAGAAAGFFILAFFLAFANTGFATFYQNHIPVGMMGRVGSVNVFLEAILVMLATAGFGLAADRYTVQAAVIAGVLVMSVLGLSLGLYVLRPSMARLPSSPPDGFIRLPEDG